MTEWTIRGMHCHSCEGLITDILTDYGASGISISAKTGKLVFTPRDPATLELIKKEIEKGGYVVK